MTPSNLTDQAYLQTDQYKDASNLNARIQLHQRFSVNKEGLHRWVFDQLDLPPTSRILELGCGSGQLWWENRDRLPPDWTLVLSDFSAGILQEARHKLRPYNHPFAWLAADAQMIPLADASVDAVIANHMLYHVPDLPRCLAEIQRVLRPRGRLYAVTNGSRHLHQIRDLHRRFGEQHDVGEITEELTFRLENGPAHLTPWMSEVSVKRFDDALVVPEVDPMLAYMCSGLRYQVDSHQVGPLRTFLEQEIARNGAIHVDKDTGMFVAIR